LKERPWAYCGILIGVLALAIAAVAHSDVKDVQARASEQARNGGGDRPASRFDYVMHTQLTLDRPLEEVWPVFKDIRRWYTEYTWEVISGPEYQSGVGLVEDQVIKVKSSKGLTREPNSDVVEGPEYFIQKTIKVVPQKEIVVALSGSAYDWKQYTVFYVWTMTEKGRKTTVYIDSYGEAELATALPKREFSEYYGRFTKDWHHSWSEAFMNLRKVLDAPH
jgi:hypothetical protein